MQVSEKKNYGENTIKEQELKKQKMTIGIVSKFLKIKFDLKVRYMRKETVSIELMIKSSNFNFKMRPNCQYSLPYVP